MPGRKPNPKHKTRVAMRKNRNVRVPEADLNQYLRDPEAAEADLNATQSIRPKGAMSRHRNVELSRLHWYELEIPPEAREECGVVVRMFGAYAQVESDRGPALCSLRRILRTVQTAERGAVAVGDQVTFKLARADSGIDRPPPYPPPEGGLARTETEALPLPPSRREGEGCELARLPQGVIERVLPRGGELCRRAKGRWHTLAANVDQLLIITSCAMPPVNTHLIDRYLVTAAAGGLNPVIILNKTDLEPETASPAGSLARLHKIYDRLEAPILSTSAISGAGVDEFRGLLAGRKSAIAGESGVGKSSLLNAAYPDLKLAIKEVSAFWQHGRHATSTAVLIPLPAGLKGTGFTEPGSRAGPKAGFVVDTPGVRQLGLWDLPPRDLAAYFSDISAAAARCRFNDCTHTVEEGCAVRTALESGEIHPLRYESYLQLIAESR